MSGFSATPQKKPVTDVFAVSGTWNKPEGYDPSHIVTVQIWSGGGGGSSTRGGGGGAYFQFTCRMGDLPNEVNLAVGAGGSSGRNGGDGGSSSFYGISVPGGSGAKGTSYGQGGVSPAGAPYNGGWGGELTFNNKRKNAIFGGGGGGEGQAQGSSIFGGNGGGPNGPPVAPSGGGKPHQAGARGEVKVIY